jgi:hypothetical protein
MKGRIIVIEGACDGIGKSTQYSLLKEELEKEGKVITHHFPSYDTPQGKGVEEYLNGSLGEISVDFIEWNTLLLALNNNNKVDVLSNSLLNIKHELNEWINDMGQNVNSNVTIAENNETTTIANGTTPYHPEHATNAVFDDKHGLYEFHEGCGYNDYPDNYNKYRNLNNRGVLVFESDDFQTIEHRTGKTGEQPSEYTYELIRGEIYPKRMYINSNGILCTKEYFDAEQDETSQDYNNTIAGLIKRIEALEEVIQYIQIQE